MNQYVRQLRQQEPINWEITSNIWRNLMGTKIEIKFSEFFDEIVDEFIKSPKEFLNQIKKSQTEPAKILADFLSLDIVTRSIHFFSFFRFIFDFTKLEKFVCQTNFEPSHFKEHFGDRTSILFNSICYLYKKMTTSLNHSIFPKYALKTIRLFSKLLVPEGYRQFTSTNFRLQFVYISPVFYTKNKSPKAQGYCCIGEKGDFVILDTTPDNKLIDKFDQNSYTGMVDEEHILFYQNDMTPVIKLEFPTPDNANDAFIFSITPPEPGLMHIISFLHSFSAVSQQQRLFGNSSLPKIFKTEVQKVIETPTMELLLYAFATPQKISKINEKTIDFFISALGDKLMPFIRALIHMVWSEEPFGGSIILRHDSPLSSLLRLILKFYCGDYLSYMEAEIKSIIEESNDFIREMPISNNEDALAFIDHVFNPEINLFFGSVDHKMSSTLRSIIRVVFIRTAGFYINQHAPYLVIPNLMLLRFLLPHMTTKISLAFPSGSKVQSISKLAASSFLSLFYRNGWTSDPFLSKFGKFMEKYYYESVRFAIHVIDCHKWEFENTDTYLDDKWDLIDLLGDAANNLILMNMKSPNKILNTHIYSISIMQMIEEYTYDFSILSTESWKKDQFI